MGKHGTEYARVERDLYPTPAWVVHALAEHVEFAGKVVWEPAAGTGQMAEALKAAGATRVYCSDIHRYWDYPLDEVLDFTTARRPRLPDFDGIVTNAPGGEGNKLAEKFIEVGLGHLGDGQTLALLLPVDFDSAIGRPRLFRDCPYFIMKIVLLGRIVWFKRADGEKEAPKENHAWFVWQRGGRRHPPVIKYATKPKGPRSDLRKAWKR